ncbi:uncharacterized protein LOC120000291 isoform X2 [Tripterygium wilfordii]|uniref:uncharacterized protein LOC120000291 isoform X2 n=1 Tax=Tripterygium wilfordii TaxID=458696 RepID=UPI0018F84E8B|nr:uncharacterized protein LOC120000291 isoform X2 [Tripterygium wilfordii]
MEGFDCTIFDGAARKKRSRISRRPRPESLPYLEFHDRSSLSSTPSLDDVSKVSSHENCFDINPTRKEPNLSQCFSPSCAVGGEYEKSHVENEENGLFTAVVSCEEGQSENKPSGKGILASANRKNTSKVKAGLAPLTAGAEIYIGRKVESQDSGKYGGIAVGLENENKVKKVVKLKVGGVTSTFHANSSSKVAYGDMPSAKNYQSSEASGLGPENPQGDLWHDHYALHRRSGLQGIRRKDSSHGGFNFRKEESSMVNMSGKKTSRKVGDKLEPVRKSRRVPKRRVFDGEFGEEDDDDEIRYLEKLKLNVDASYKEEEGPGKRQRELGKVGNIESGSSKSVKDRMKKLGPERASDGVDYQEDEELVSDGELESDEKQKEDSVDTSMDGKREIALTTRQRALQSNKDGSSTRGSSLIEFPDGLPPAPSRKQKEKLSVGEEQLKKTEAAQRRRMQVEKAAKESQAEAIRKILGQDSGRKKREDKIKQRQEELAQEKAANALKVGPNTIRCVDGPSGTVVTFSNDMVLPNIFDSKPWRPIMC